MSTKATMLLSRNNEHWYYDYADGCIILEFSPEHKIEKNDDGIEIVIEPGTALHATIQKEIREKIRKIVPKIAVVQSEESGEQVCALSLLKQSEVIMEANNLEPGVGVTLLGCND